MLIGAQGLAPEPGVLRHKRWDNDDIVTLTVTIPGRHHLSFVPGQFNMLYAHGVGEIPISISGMTRDRHAFLHTVRVVGAVSKALAEAKPGQIVGVRGPYGRGWPLGASDRGALLIIAGGLGIAPLRPAISWVRRNRRRFSDFWLIYGARNSKDFIYVNEWPAWSAQDLGVFRPIVDRSDRSWRGLVGTPCDVLPRQIEEPAKAVALVCGPEVMMRHVCRDLLALGLLAEHIFISIERNMHCAIGICGRCQFGPYFVCQDGPIFSFDRVEKMLSIPEL